MAESARVIGREEMVGALRTLHERAVAAGGMDADLERMGINHREVTDACVEIANDFCATCTPDVAACASALQGFRVGLLIGRGEVTG